MELAEKSRNKSKCLGGEVGKLNTVEPDNELQSAVIKGMGFLHIRLTGPSQVSTQNSTVERRNQVAYFIGHYNISVIYNWGEGMGGGRKEGGKQRGEIKSTSQGIFVLF